MEEVWFHTIHTLYCHYEDSLLWSIAEAVVPGAGAFEIAAYCMLNKQLDTVKGRAKLGVKVCFSLNVHMISITFRISLSEMPRFLDILGAFYRCVAPNGSYKGCMETVCI